jgi:hypothetical protein
MDKHIDTETNNGVTEDNYLTSDGAIVQNFSQDITQLLEDNKSARNATSDWVKYDPKQNYHQVLDLSMTDAMRSKSMESIYLTIQIWIGSISSSLLKHTTHT